MPLYDLVCGSCSTKEEHWLRHFDAPNPACSHCGGSMSRSVSRFAFGWGKSLSAYQDKSMASGSGYKDYHIGWNRDGTREVIDSRQKQKEFSRRNGFEDPVGLPTKARMVHDETGRGKLVTDNVSEI